MMVADAKKKSDSGVIKQIRSLEGELILQNIHFIRDNRDQMVKAIMLALQNPIDPNDRPILEKMLEISLRDLQNLREREVKTIIENEEGK